jgi:hypothetical protein
MTTVTVWRPDSVTAGKSQNKDLPADVGLTRTDKENAVCVGKNECAVVPLKGAPVIFRGIE